MGRKKINVEFIEKDSKRRATFKKRKESVLKKARELSTLCGIRMCVIIDSPYEPGYEVLPSEEEATELAHRFKNLSKKEKSATTTTPEVMLRQEVMKTQEQIIKLKLENRELESEILMHEYMTGARSMREIGSDEARGILWVAEKRLRAVQARIEALSSSSKADNVENAPAPAPAPAPVLDCSCNELKSGLHEAGDEQPCDPPIKAGLINFM